MFVNIFRTKKKYDIIYADPPWKFIVRSKIDTGKKSPARHYKCQDIEWIKNLPIKKISNKNCILFLWVTYPMLEKCFEVINAWGFTYSTCGFTWVKLTKNNKYHFGLGYWTRANPELCLIAIKGSPKRVSKNIRNLIFSKIQEHSHKPNEIRNNIIQLCGDLPRIELFARQKIKRWDCWGDEVE